MICCRIFWNRSDGTNLVAFSDLAETEKTCGEKMCVYKCDWYGEISFAGTASLK